MPRVVEARGIRTHWNYTVAEVAELCGVHRNTVRAWIGEGLPVIGDRKPFLIRGSDLKAFLEARAKRRKQPLADGEFYCFACRKPRRPVAGLLDYETAANGAGRLVGLCAVCETVMYRSASRADAARLLDAVGVTIVTAADTLDEPTGSPANSDLGQD